MDLLSRSVELSGRSMLITGITYNYGSHVELIFFLLHYFRPKPPFIITHTNQAVLSFTVDKRG